MVTASERYGLQKLLDGVFPSQVIAVAVTEVTTVV
jgi:hypothetical protein